MDSDAGDAVLTAPGFPIRRSPDQSLLGGSPGLIAACRVLHRFPVPGHPSYSLSKLDAKGQFPTCAVVKEQDGGLTWTRTRNLCLIRTAL